MLYVFYGENDFTLKETLAELKSGVGEGEMASLNTSFLNGKTTSFPELRDLCDTVPFLAPQRLVIVEGLLSRFEPRRRNEEGRQSPAPPSEGLGEWEKLAEYVKNMPPFTVLIITDGPISPQNPLKRALASAAQVREFRPIRGAALLNWIREGVSKKGGRITPQAVRLLADLVGVNLWIMDGELEKLLLYSADHPIGEEDVLAVVCHSKEANIFSLVDAIAVGKLTQASRLLHQLLDDGAAPPYVLFMITRQFRFLIMAKELVAKKVPPPEMGKRLGLRSDYAVEKTMEQAKRYSPHQLEEVFQRLLESDLAIKTGKRPPDLALDLLVAELCK